jgi:hypothetical protein
VGASPVTDLERRRRAIVEALRQVAREAPPTPAAPEPVEDPRVSRLEQDVADVRRHLRELSARLHAHGRDAAAGTPAPPPSLPPATLPPVPPPPPVRSGFDALIDISDGPLDVPPVPPVEDALPMRDRAARALFGY